MGKRYHRRIRLDRSVYDVPGQPFFITLCATGNGRPFEDVSLATAIWHAVRKGHLSLYADLSAACLMPDHLHLLIAPVAASREDASQHTENLIDLIGRWKSFTTKLARDRGHIGSLWQKSFYDHALRKDEDILAIATYIVDNPVRAGLVLECKEYPYVWDKWM